MLAETVSEKSFSDPSTGSVAFAEVPHPLRALPERVGRELEYKYTSVPFATLMVKVFLSDETVVVLPELDTLEGNVPPFAFKVIVTISDQIA